MKAAFTLLFLIICFLTKAQSFFVPGYIILKGQTDTLKGYIDDQNWKVHPKKVFFKMENSNQNTFDINALEAFGIQNKEHYWVKKVDIDFSPVDASFLRKTPELLIKKDTTLALRVLLKSKLSLLSYYSSGLKVHFFYSNDKETKELIDHHYLRERNYVIAHVQNKIYEAQLKLLFYDCSEVMNSRELRFHESSLIDYFVKYNKCIGSEKVTTSYNLKEKNKVSIGVSVGASQTIRDMTSVNVTNLETIESRRLHISPLYGISTNIYSKRNWGKTFLTLEFMLQNNQINYSVEEPSYTWTNLHFSPILRSSYKMKTKFNPFWGLGLNFTRNLGLKSIDKSTTIYNLSDRGSFKVFLDNGFELGKLLISIRINFNLQSDHSIVKLYNKATDFNYEIEHYPFRLDSNFLLTYKFK